MKEQKLGCFGQIWNIFWFVFLILSLLFAWYIFNLSEDHLLLKAGSAFATVTSAIGTVFQVYKKKPSGFLKVIKQEFSIIRRTVLRANDDNKEHVTNEHEKTRGEINKLRETSNQSSNQMSDLDKHDIDVLHTIFQILPWQMMDKMVNEDYFNHRVKMEDIDRIDCYEKIRLDPYYKVFDNEIEKILVTLTTKIDKMSSKSSDLNGLPKTYIPYYVASYKTEQGFSRERNSDIEKYNHFYKTEVIPVWKTYQQLVNTLIEKKIYHLVSNQSKLV